MPVARATAKSASSGCPEAASRKRRACSAVNTCISRWAATRADLELFFEDPQADRSTWHSYQQVEKGHGRLELARHLGADLVVNASAEDVEMIVRSWTDGEGPAVIVEATGVPSVIRQAVELVASAGRIVIIGVSTRDVSLPAVEFTRKELTILGSRNNTGVFGEAVALLRRNRERARLLITHRFSLAETPQALEFALNHPTEAEKVVISLKGSAYA